MRIRQGVTSNRAAQGGWGAGAEGTSRRRGGRVGGGLEGQAQDFQPQEHHRKRSWWTLGSAGGSGELE